MSCHHLFSPRPARRTPLGRRTLVFVAASLASLLIAGCGEGSDATITGAARLSAQTAAEDATAVSSNPSTAALPTPPTTAPPTATTTTLRPLEPHEVLVAAVRAEVTELAVYDAPNGTVIQPELALVNPWYFQAQLVLLVTGGREGDAWVEVALPVRPNGTTAWIRSSDVTFRSHRFHVTVAIGERMLRAYEADRLVFETRVVVGRAATPTPLGRFFINADIPQSNALGAYGPLILSVSSYSEVLATFDGGLPAIGLHGTNQPSLVGQAMSNGCIRMPNDAVLALAALVPIGTPVDFVA